MEEESMNHINQTNNKVAFYDGSIEAKTAIEEIFSCIEGDTLYMLKILIGEVSEASYIYKLNVQVDSNSKEEFGCEIDKLFNEVNKVITQIYSRKLNGELFIDNSFIDIKDIKVLEDKTIFDIAMEYLRHKDDKSLNNLAYNLHGLIRISIMFNDFIKKHGPLTDACMLSVIQILFIDHYATNIEEIEVIE